MASATYKPDVNYKVVNDLKPIHILVAIQTLEYADMYSNGLLTDKEFLYAIGYDVPQEQTDTLLLMGANSLISE